MNRREYWNCLLGGINRVGVGLIGMLVFSIVLWAVGLQMGDLGELARGLFLLVLATWVGMSALAGAAMIPIWMVVLAKTRCRK